PVTETGQVQRARLAALVQSMGVSVALTSDANLPITVVLDGARVKRALQASTGRSDWCVVERAESVRTIRQRLDEQLTTARPVTADELATTGARYLQFQQGQHWSTGEEFARALGLLPLAVAGDVVWVRYRDRYARGPAVRLLAGLLEALPLALGARVRINALEALDGLDKEARMSELTRALSELPVNKEVNLIAARDELPHARALELGWADHTSQSILLDGGFDAFARLRDGYYVGQSTHVVVLPPTRGT
ncbi:MAG: hypothetical protein ACRDIY_21130, partial [Chloroflexota bacterium]